MFIEEIDPFNEFDLRSFKIIEILGTSSEIKTHSIGWLISAKKKYKTMKKLKNIFILKQDDLFNFYLRSFVNLKI